MKRSNASQGTRADASGPLPQYSLDGRATGASTADDSFDRAPTLVRPSLNASQAAEVLRAIERRRPRAAVEELDADALVDASGPKAPLPQFAASDVSAPVMSTSEIRFFDAAAATAALEERAADEDDAAAVEPDAAPVTSRARIGRRAVAAVLSLAGLVLIAGAATAASRPSEAASPVEEIYALARGDVSSSRAEHQARAAAAAKVSGEAKEPTRVETTGKLVTPATAAAKTLFVDGITMGRAPLDVSCGLHRVRVGERGETHPVDVPCGGSALVR